MQIRSFRGSGEPVWVNALSSACERLGPNPRRALGPAATPAASIGRTRDRTRPMLQKRQKVLARAPSTRGPEAELGGWRLRPFTAPQVLVEETRNFVVAVRVHQLPHLNIFSD